MIIVSQEKDAILNFDNVIGIRTEIDIESNKETRIAIDTIDSERYYIARYSTEERTKEVLQEILEAYKATETFKAISNRISDEVGAIAIKNGFVYEMPEE